MVDHEPQLILLVEAAGGVMRHVIDLYKGLRIRNIKVKMVLSPNRIDERYKSELSALDPNDIEYVSMRRAPHLSDLSALLQIRKIINRYKGQSKVVLHAHSTKAGALGSLLCGMVDASIFTPHAYRGLDPELKGTGRHFVEFIEKSYSRSYDRVIALSPAEFSYALKLGVSKQALHLIPNGISIRNVDFDKLYQQRRMLSTPPVLGFVGRMVYQKNPLLFIEVLHEVVRRGHDVKAIVVGDGPLRPEMEKLAQRHGLMGRIDWRGEIAATPVYPEMDIMLHTSLYEGLPYSILEACVALLPVVATSNQGSEAILGGSFPENLSSKPDSFALAESVIRLLGDEQLRMRQTKSLRELATHYSTDSMIDQLIEQLDMVLHRTPHPSFR